jgi:N-acetyl-anhydromuramyl-L-alanine amidase AmpD
LLTPQDLGVDVMTYRYEKAVLSGAFVPITEIKPFGSAGQEIPGGGAMSTSNVPEKVNKEYVNWVESYFNTITPTGIIIHHSAVLPATSKVPAALEEVENYHAARGFAIECEGREYHVAYHYLIFPDGKIQAGRPERCEGAHARGYNSFIGISLVGDFSAKDPHFRGKPARPTGKQVKSLLRLTRQLQREYNIPVQRILRHSDVAPTLCPGERFAFKSFLLALEQPQADGR